MWFYIEVKIGRLFNANQTLILSLEGLTTLQSKQRKIPPKIYVIYNLQRDSKQASIFDWATFEWLGDFFLTYFSHSGIRHKTRLWREVGGSLILDVFTELPVQSVSLQTKVLSLLTLASIRYWFHLQLKRLTCKFVIFWLKKFFGSTREGKPGQDDRLKILHDHQEGWDFWAQVRAQFWQEGEEARSSKEGEIWMKQIILCQIFLQTIIQVTN